MSYSTAEQAILSFGAGKKLDKRLATKKMRKIAKVMGIKPKYRGNFSEWIDHLFNRQLDLFAKSIRVAQLNGTDQFVVFSDVYHIQPWGEEKLEEMRSKRLIHGTFIKKYPRLDRYVPKGKWYHGGYRHISRGMLHGFIF